MKKSSRGESCSVKEREAPSSLEGEALDSVVGSVEEKSAEGASAPASVFSAQNRYSKKSLFTMGMALMAPSFVYGLLEGISPQHLNGFLALVSLFAHPLAVVFNSYTSWGYSSSLMVSCSLQVFVLVWAFRSKRFSPKGAFTTAILLGMVDFVGLKVLCY